MILGLAFAVATFDCSGAVLVDVGVADPTPVRHRSKSLLTTLAIWSKAS